MPDLKPFLVLGLALGGVYAMSGVGLVVLYRATGVLNLAYGAVGAPARSISWSLLGRREPSGSPTPPASCFGGVLTLLYGCVLGPPFAARDPLVKATRHARLRCSSCSASCSGVWTADVRTPAPCRPATGTTTIG